MNEILAMASVIAPVTTGIVELMKKSGVSHRFIPLMALIVGVLLGAAAFSFTDLYFVDRLWAGLISGLASVGLFELGKQVKKEGKNEKTKHDNRQG